MKNVKYFCAPNLREVLPTIKPGMFDYLAESPTLRPFAIQTSHKGFAFDFNCGLRLQIPAGNWHVTILDFDSEDICFDEDVSDVLLISLEKFFVRWRFLLYLDGKLVFAHEFNPTGLKVHFYYPSEVIGIGDQIALFPYMEAFRKKWNCRISCTIGENLQELLRVQFPALEYSALPGDSYATYLVMPCFDRMLFPKNPITLPMEKFGRYIFGLNSAEKIIYRPTKPRQISEPYVCIAVQTSATIKTWLNPNGWSEVVAYLKSLGYRVLCIDKNREQTDHGFTVKIPDGAEDFTGNLPLSERVNLLAYAEFFIGMTSGLSWLAWAANIPVVLISGISACWHEFSTPYRIANQLVCNGCYNDTEIPVGKGLDCIKHGGTDRAYECQWKISARQVINAIDQLISDKREERFSYPNFL